MASIGDLIGTCDQLLNPSAFSDAAPNGLQVPGRTEIRTVATGVSASVELFARAAELDADLVLVHHGLFWKGPPRALDLGAKRRLQTLFDSGMALAAYHLPLDGHPELGNAALVARALGATATTPWGGRPAVGVVAELPGLSPADLVARVREATGGREPLAFLDGPDPVRRLAIVTGEAAGLLEDAIADGLDGLLTGEPSERVMTRAREAEVHFVAAGHYATETFGVRALGDVLAREHGVRHVFVDVPNPI